MPRRQGVATNIAEGPPVDPAYTRLDTEHHSKRKLSVRLIIDWLQLPSPNECRVVSIIHNDPVEKNVASSV